MKRTNSLKGLFKRTAALMVSMALAFGAVSVLPNSVVKDHTVVASAEKDRSNFYCADVNGCIFYFTIRNEEAATIIIEDVDIYNDEGKVDIPPTITYEGKKYTVVEIGWSFLNRDKTVKSVIMPNTVTSISSNVLWQSTIEKLTLSDNLENINYGFCYDCQALTRENVKYNGTKLKSVGAHVLESDGMYNENRVVSLNNWLIRYNPKNSPTGVKIADLGENGVKIDSIASEAIYANTLTSVDLEGIKIIKDNNFAKHQNLTTVSNYESLIELGSGVFNETPWFNNNKEKGVVRIGPFLIYYKTDGNVIDLTSDALKGVTKVYPNTFSDCINANTLMCSSDLKLAEKCFYATYTPIEGQDSPRDPMPNVSVYKIKTIYLDGKKLTYDLEDPIKHDWVKENFLALRKSEFIKQCVEEKTKALFKQLDIPYYGTNNDKIGTLSATEEFYIKLKLHDYIGIFKYDYTDEYKDNCMFAFLLGGLLDCQTYADLEAYLLECAGVETKSLNTEIFKKGIYTYRHVWNSVKIGDEWFESDDGWDGQGSYGYGWFALSSNTIQKNTGDKSHDYSYAYDSWHSYPIESLKTERVEAKRVLGDLNGDNQRDEKDTKKLWEYIMGSIKLKDPTIADINFDGVVDVTDAVLLENFVGGKSIDTTRYPDGVVPGYLGHGFKVAYWDTEDTDYIDIQYDWTDADGYIVLPKVEYKTPEGKKFGGWNYGKANKVGKPGEKVKISNPYTVIKPVWKNESDPDGDMLLGDVDGSGTIDISDVSKLINHINGVKALDEDEFLRADVNMSKTVEISDASAIVNHINGVKAIEGTV